MQAAQSKPLRTAVRRGRARSGELAPALSEAFEVGEENLRGRTERRDLG